MDRDTLEEWSRPLRVPRRRRRAIALELKDHLVAAEHDLLASGFSTDEARAESARHLGEPAQLADAFRRVHRPSRRRKIGLAAVLSTSIVFGIFGANGTFASPTSRHHHTVTSTPATSHCRHHTH